MRSQYSRNASCLAAKVGTYLDVSTQLKFAPFVGLAIGDRSVISPSQFALMSVVVEQAAVVAQQEHIDNVKSCERVIEKTWGNCLSSCF